MEPAEKFNIKIDILQKALLSFKRLMASNLSLFDEVISDGIKNGQIQKFEYCSELTWKTLKKYLILYHGIDSKTPKSNIKDFFLSGHISEIQYETLIAMIDDRNKLSHVYIEDDFEILYQKLPKYLNIMLEVLNILEKNTG